VWSHLQSFHYGRSLNLLSTRAQHQLKTSEVKVREVKVRFMGGDDLTVDASPV
jgi:hypothetical protein